MYRYHALKRGGWDKLRSCPHHVLFILKKSKIITASRLVHYGQSALLRSILTVYGQAISGPGDYITRVTDARQKQITGHNVTYPFRWSFRRRPPTHSSCRSVLRFATPLCLN